jgi:cytochrome c oxidase subunit 2
MLTVLEYILLAIFVAVLLVISRWLGHQAYSWMPTEATAEAQHVDELFAFLVAVGAFVFLGIIGVILYSLLFFRASPPDYSEGSPIRGNWKIEALWTIIPTVLVLWIAFQSYKIYERLNILGLTPIVHLHLEEPAYAESVENDAKPAAQEIEVIAKQWAWSFRYPNNVTSNELHLPVNESVRLVLHSEDVIHGFYVPEFRVKQDIIPARTITFVFAPNRSGKYLLRDSQFSGTYFALMEADVYVESREAYDRWLASAAVQEPTSPTNRAFLEYSQPPPKILHSGWQTVPPA